MDDQIDMNKAEDFAKGLTKEASGREEHKLMDKTPTEKPVKSPFDKLAEDLFDK